MFPSSICRLWASSLIPDTGGIDRLCPNGISVTILISGHEDLALPEVISQPSRNPLISRLSSPPLTHQASFQPVTRDDSAREDQPGLQTTENRRRWLKQIGSLLSQVKEVRRWAIRRCEVGRDPRSSSLSASTYCGICLQSHDLAAVAPTSTSAFQPRGREEQGLPGVRTCSPCPSRSIPGEALGRFTHPPAGCACSPHGACPFFQPVCWGLTKPTPSPAQLHTGFLSLLPFPPEEAWLLP